MQEGSFRCDANVSVRKVGSDKLGTRCEIKNLNSFRFMEQAIEFEARRQIDILEDGGKIDQETRLYDPDKNETRSMRSKEDAQDYRYFPDPDLLPLLISEADIERVRAQMPESLEDIRLNEVYGVVPVNLRSVLTATREMANFSTRALTGASAGAQPIVVNLISGPLSAKMNKDSVGDPTAKVSPDDLRALAELVSKNEISASAANQVVPIMWDTGKSALAVVDERDLRQVSDVAEIEKLVDDAIAAGAKQVADYRAGKEKALQSLVGQVMKASKGKANPAQVNEILRRKLGG
jgi:aspartyl-tRNA(Asn)/glutamyl-tRNA(Gln) amidotransferase subunit B